MLLRTILSHGLSHITASVWVDDIVSGLSPVRATLWGSNKIFTK